MPFWRSNARPAMREGRHWGNSQETGTEPGLALEDRRELVAGDAGVLALRRHSPQTFRPIRTTTKSRRCGSGAACLWDVRVAGVYGIGVAVQAAALPGDMAPAADVRCRHLAAVADRGRERRNWASKRPLPLGEVSARSRRSPIPNRAKQEHQVLFEPYRSKASRAKSRRTVRHFCVAALLSSRDSDCRT